MALVVCNSADYLLPKKSYLCLLLSSFRLGGAAIADTATFAVHSTIGLESKKAVKGALCGST